MTPDRRTLLALFSLAFGLRILYAAVLGASPDAIAALESYDFRIAAKMADGLAWLTHPVSPTAPGYRTLLSIAFRLAGTSWWTAVLLNSILGAALTVFLYRIGEQRLGRGVGLIAAVWVGVFVHQIHYASVVGRDVLVTFLLVWFVHSLVKPFHRARNAVWSAILYGALTYTEPMFLILLPLVLVYLALGSARHRAMSAQYVFLFSTALLLLNVPWTIRNYVVRHDIVPIGLEASRYLEPITRLLRDTPPDPPLSPEATTIVRPGFIYETRELWRVVRLSDFPGDPARGLAPEPAWSLRHNVANLFNFGVLLPLFVVGMAAAWRQRHRAALVLSVSIVSYAILRGFLGGADRARVPIEPLVVLVALFAVRVLLDARRRAGVPAQAAVDATPA